MNTGDQTNAGGDQSYRVSISRERAKELRLLCSPLSFRWKFKPETPEETKRIKEIRAKGPGYANWYSTLCEIEQGRIQG